MPHSPKEKKKALSRIRRIRGQAEALERTLEAGAECNVVLQQLAAIRGAVNSLMSEVLEMHLREELGHLRNDKRPPSHDSIDEAVTLVRTYFK